METQIRVAFFHIGSGTFTGGSKMLLKLLRSFSDSTIEPILISQVDDELCMRARDAGISVEIVPFRGVLDSYNRRLLTTSPRILIPSAVRILQFNREIYTHIRDVDAVWCQNIRAILTLLPYISLSTTPIIWNIGLGLKSEGKMKHLNSLALSASDYVFIESETQAARVFTDSQLAKHRDKFTIFRKGIDVERFRADRDHPPLTESPYTIGTAAALTPRKGIDYLLESAAELLETRDDIQVYIAGEPTDADGDEYVSQLRNQVSAAGIEDSVTFHGWIDDMPAFLETVDIFVLPSHNEGIPGVVRESLAMELPVIATDVGGTKDVVKHEETGLLVPPADSDAITDALKTMLGNKTDAREMGRRGRELIVEEFSMQSYVDNYRDFLLEVTA